MKIKGATSNPSVVENAPIFTAEQLLPIAALSNFDLTTGKVSAPAVPVIVDTQFLRIQDPSVQGTLRQKLEKAMAEVADHTAAQGSDPHSTAIVVFKAFDDSAKLLGFGVWAGAPGDIGLARLQLRGAEGDLVTIVDEPS